MKKVQGGISPDIYGCGKYNSPFYALFD